MKKSFLHAFIPLFPPGLPENIIKPLVFECFQGYQKGTLGRNELQ